MATSPFDAVADPTRRRILDTLRRKGRMRAGDLAGQFPRISRPAVSKHLRVLRSSRLVQVQREGRQLWYQLNAEPLSEVEGWVQQYAAFWDERLQKLKQAAEE